MFSKKILTAIFLIALISTAQAQAYNISRHEIQIKIKTDGFAQVTEKFFLNFPKETELAKFKQKSLDLGVSLEKWREFNQKIHIYIAGEKNIRGGTVSFVDDESEKYMKIDYETTVPIMSKKSGTTRIIPFELNKLYFQEFNKTSLWEIPSNTVISITLPVQSKINPDIKPEAILSGNQVVWVGYKTSNALILQYTLEKQIAPNIELTAFVQEIAKSQIMTTIIILLALLAIVGYIKRKAISEKIEEYVVKNSEFETEKEEKEIEFD